MTICSKNCAGKTKKLETVPDVYGKPLRGPLAGIWEIHFERRWRMLYTIDYKRKIVTLRAVKHKDERALKNPRVDFIKSTSCSRATPAFLFFNGFFSPGS